MDLPDRTAVLGGQRLNEIGISQQVPLEELWNLRTQLLASPDTDACTRWTQWFFPDRATYPPFPEP